MPSRREEDEEWSVFFCALGKRVFVVRGGEGGLVVRWECGLVSGVHRVWGAGILTRTEGEKIASNLPRINCNLH